MAAVRIIYKLLLFDVASPCCCCCCFVLLLLFCCCCCLCVPDQHGQHTAPPYPLPHHVCKQLHIKRKCAAYVNVDVVVGVDLGLIIIYVLTTNCWTMQGDT